MPQRVGQQPGQERDHQAVDEGGKRAERDERVHVGGPVRQRLPAGPVDRPAGIEHHRSDQRQL
ncbi:hypothetical protein SDC9_151108 [bioreactor metagenome]|uniref:Uncharacterized protein n=1 Tax=bioreactor metagenome TaxID=1076179 RepID=A0A645ETP5_9ZZZZ